MERDARLLREGDDRGEEPCYDGYPASELINKGYEIPHVIGLLWDKRLISKQEAEIIKRIMMLSADHGPCVSGALGTIIAACAGIGMSQSVAAGLIMIGPRFGGAVTDAGRYFKYAVDNKMTVDEFLAWESTPMDRHEFIRGEVFAMTGVIDRHNTVAINLLVVLR